VIGKILGDKKVPGRGKIKVKGLDGGNYAFSWFMTFSRAFAAFSIFLWSATSFS
jgi:hypothetical protein